MPKAEITLMNGTTVAIEGTQEEIIKITRALNEENKQKSTNNHNEYKKSIHGKTKGGPSRYISELASEDFFKTPRTIGEIQSALKERGHPYSVNSLSTPLMRTVRNKAAIRRYQDEGQYKYVNI